MLASIDVHQYLTNTAGNARAAESKATWGKIHKRMKEQVTRDTMKWLEGHKSGKAGPVPPVSVEWLVARIDPAVTLPLRSAVQHGKGSPAAFEVFITLAVRYKLADPRHLDRFADRCLGLDGSGFISNYLVQIKHLNAGAAVNRGARSYDDAANRRATLDSVRRYDLLCWADGSHVAIIDTVPVAREERVPVLSAGARPTRTVYTCDVVECDPVRGLGVESYTLESVNAITRVFTVRRRTGPPCHVHVVNRNVRP